jgi:hypothetical protein
MSFYFMLEPTIAANLEFNHGCSATSASYRLPTPARMVARTKKDQRVMIVDMRSTLTTRDVSDGLHPNDEGYDKMKKVWPIGLLAVDSLGRVGAPISRVSGGDDLSACTHDPS